MARNTIADSIFGLFDGMVTVIGMTLGMLAGPAHLIVAGAVGIAVANSISMAAGEWLGDATGNARAAAVMVAATLVGTLAPVVPFMALSKQPAELVAVGVCAVIGVGIAEARVWTNRESRWRSHLETFGLLALAFSATIAITLATGVGG